jgi:hypothetical protein
MSAEADEKARLLVSLAGNTEHRRLWKEWAEVLRTEATKLTGQQAFTSFFLSSRAVEAVVESIITHRCNTSDERNDLLFLLRMSLIHEAGRGNGGSTPSADVVQSLFARLLKLSDELCKLRAHGSQENSACHGVIALRVANTIGALKKQQPAATLDGAAATAAAPASPAGGSLPSSPMLTTAAIDAVGGGMTFQRSGSSSHSISMHNTSAVAASSPSAGTQPQSADAFDLRYIPRHLRGSSFVRRVASSAGDLSAHESPLLPEVSEDDTSCGIEADESSSDFCPSSHQLPSFHDWCVYYLGKVEATLARTDRECALFRHQRDLDATVRVRIDEQAEALKTEQRKLEAIVESSISQEAQLQAQQEQLLAQQRREVEAARSNVLATETRMADVKRQSLELKRQYDALQRELKRSDRELKEQQQRVRDLEAEPAALKQLRQTLNEAQLTKSRRVKDLQCCTYASTFVKCVAIAASEVTTSTLRLQEEIVHRHVHHSSNAVVNVMQRFHVVSQLLDECRRTFQENYDRVTEAAGREQLRDLCKEMFVRIASYGEAASRLRERLHQIERCVSYHGDGAVLLPECSSLMDGLLGSISKLCFIEDNHFLTRLDEDSAYGAALQPDSLTLLSSSLSHGGERPATPPQQQQHSWQMNTNNNSSFCSSDPPTPMPSTNCAIPDFVRRRPKKRMMTTISSSSHENTPVEPAPAAETFASPLEAATAALKQLADRQPLLSLW